MKTVILIALLLAVVRANAGQLEQVISVQHDSQRGVTCWIVNNTGISCLPDSSLPQKAALSSEIVRAFPASFEPESEAFQAIPLPQDERLQL